MEVQMRRDVSKQETSHTNKWLGKQRKAGEKKSGRTNRTGWKNHSIFTNKTNKQKKHTQYTVKHITYTDTVCGKIHITATTKILEVIEPDEQVYIDHAAGTRHTVRDEISCYPGALAALKALKSYCE